MVAALPRKEAMHIVAIELNLQGDFATILDGAESVTLLRYQSSKLVAVGTAWRYSQITAEAEPSGAAAQRTDTVWQFPWHEPLDPPRVGDAILDGARRCWTILTVERLTAMTRWRCRCRDLQIAFGLDHRVEVQQAEWDDPGGGPEIVGWRTVRSVAARIQLNVVTVDQDAEPVDSTATYEVILGERLDLDHNHRLVGPDGAIYQVLEYRRAARIDALPIATVVRRAV